MNSSEARKTFIEAMHTALPSHNVSATDLLRYANLALKASLGENDLPDIMERTWAEAKHRLEHICHNENMPWPEACDRYRESVINSVMTECLSFEQWQIEALCYLYKDRLHSKHSDCFDGIIQLISGRLTFLTKIRKP